MLTTLLMFRYFFFLVITESQRNDIKRYGSPGIQAFNCDVAVGSSCCHRRVFFNLSCLQFLLLSYEIQTEISKKIRRVWNQSQVKREKTNSEHREAASHDHSTNPSLGISALQKELQGHIRLQENVKVNGTDGVDLDIEIFLQLTGAWLPVLCHGKTVRCHIRVILSEHKVLRNLREIHLTFNRPRGPSTS